MKAFAPQRIVHVANVFWVTFEAKDDIVLMLDKMIRTFDRGYPGNEGLVSDAEHESPLKQIRGMKMLLTSDLSRTDETGAYGLLFSGDNSIDLVLMKGHPLFKKIMSYLEERAKF